MKRVVIIGAGPTGLGAAYRLKELGHDNFVVYERHPHAGGLCSSISDEYGFTWDLGGHVIFSRFEYFNELLHRNPAVSFLEHQREAWVYLHKRWVPYPFQNHIRHLSPEIMQECLQGLKDVDSAREQPRNFQEWIRLNFGAGIAKHFMVPYNAKVWAYPLEELGAGWIAERVSKVRYREIKAAIDKGEDFSDWGPNSKFKYPLTGGVRGIFQQIFLDLEDKIVLNAELIRIDPDAKTVHFPDGKSDTYDALINTAPVDRFLNLWPQCPLPLRQAAGDLKHNGVFIVGIGIRRPCPSTKCWIYFPEDNAPFYRVTYLSNYSPANVPDKGFYSLLCETSYSDHRPESENEIVEKTIQGLLNVGLLKPGEVKQIVSRFLYDVDYAYPIPTLERDKALAVIQAELLRRDIFSRGRFGAWKYEVGNTDHSVMQGKEAADRILGVGEETLV